MISDEVKLWKTVRAKQTLINIQNRMGVLWGLFKDGSVQALRDADEIADNIVRQNWSAAEALDQVKVLSQRIVKRGKTALEAIADLKSYSSAAKNAATNNNWTSPGGLSYIGLDPQGRTRLAHVLVQHGPHAPPAANKSLFKVETNEEALLLIDEGWTAMPKIQDPKDLPSWVINAGKRIGTRGETQFQLILEYPLGISPKVISAYPCGVLRPCLKP